MVAMRNITKNEKGLTLIELLATITILFIVSSLLYNIMLSGNKQNKEQVTESLQINDSAYILKQITKDIRKTYNITKDPDHPDRYLFMDKESKQIVEYTYKNKELSRNNAIIAFHIDRFSILTDTTSATVRFTMNDQTYETTLLFRRGDE